MHLCMHVQKPVDRSVLGILFYHSPPYSLRQDLSLKLLLVWQPARSSKPLRVPPTMVGLQSGIQPHPGLVSNKVKDEDQHRRLSSDLLTSIDMPGIYAWPYSYTWICTHMCTYISYTVKFFKTQEKHIRETYICKKTIPKSLLGNAFWVLILLVCRRREGKKSSSPKQEDTAQVQSNGRVPAAQETEVERSLELTSSRQACTMQWGPVPAPQKWQPVLPPALMTKLDAKLSYSPWMGLG